MAKFIRKRDPRYKHHLETQNSVANIPKPQPTTEKPHKSAADYVEQDWQKVDTKHLHADLDWAAAEGEEEEEWECVACRKTFRSEAAWDSHERSKKHLKEIERLKWEMQEEDEALGLDEEPIVEEASQPDPPASDDESDPSLEIEEKIPEAIETRSGDQEEEEFPKRRGKAKRRQVLEGDVEISANDQQETATDDLPSNPPQATKRDKRRARQQAKAEAASASGAIVSSCCVCFNNRFLNARYSIDAMCAAKNLRVKPSFLIIFCKQATPLLRKTTLQATKQKRRNDRVG